jgi:hypothetical protein
LLLYLYYFILFFCYFYCLIFRCNSFVLRKDPHEQIKAMIILRNGKEIDNGLNNERMHDNREKENHEEDIESNASHSPRASNYIPLISYKSRVPILKP